MDKWTEEHAQSLSDKELVDMFRYAPWHDALRDEILRRLAAGTLTAQEIERLRQAELREVSG